MVFVRLFYTAEELVHYLFWAALKQFSAGKLGSGRCPCPGRDGMGFSRTTPAFSGNPSASRGDHAFSTKNKNLMEPNSAERASFGFRAARGAFAGMKSSSRGVILYQE